MPDILWLDAETRSRCDLKKYGSYNYAADKSTQVLIASYAINQGPVKRWPIYKGKAIPADLANALTDKRVQVRAHGSFERVVVLPTLGWRNFPLERYYDTMAQMRALALPGKLEHAAWALKLREQKSKAGAGLIRLLSIPRADGTFNNDPALLQQFGDYCDQDVNVMRMLSMGFPQMTPEALATYRASEIINDRGMPIDGELCELALHYADEARDEAAASVVAITGGKLTKARGPKLTTHIHDLLDEKYKYLMETVRYNRVADYAGGMGIDPKLQGNKARQLGSKAHEGLTLDRTTRENIIAVAEENPDDFDDALLGLVEAAEAAAPASVAKFERMLNQVSSDGRLRGAFVFNGAAQTGRFSAHGAQVHNFPRLCAKNPDEVLKLMRKRAKLPGGTLTVLKSMLRAAIAPKGKVIVRSDWSAVEARGLPWLTDDPRAEHYLDAFRDPTRDVYLEQAAATGLGDNRQGGKVEVLSLGYGGAGGALARMAAAQGVTFPVALPTIVARWRKANPWAPHFWKSLDRAAKYALADPSQRYKAGRVSFAMQTTVNWTALTMRLPCGRDLYYPFPAIEEGNITYLKSAWRPKAKDDEGKPVTEWPRARLWGGLLAENATQATCASLLRASLVTLVEEDANVVGHVHDENIGEASRVKSAGLRRAQERAMLASLGWAKGFPLAVESDISERFRK